MVIKHFALFSILLLSCLTSCTGKTSPHASTKEFAVAQAYFDNGQMEKAAENLSAGLESARKEKVPEKELCPHLLSLSRCYLAQGKTDEAALLSRRALLAARDKFGPENMALVPYLLQESRASYKMKDFPTSSQSALEALRLQEKHLGHDAEELIETFNLIVSAACADDHCIDTEPYVKRQLDLRRRYLGAEHPHVASSLCLLGELCEKGGRFDDAEAYYAEAVAIRQKVEPELVAGTRKNLVRIHLKKMQ